jgi:hypothetical protein
LVVTNGRLSGAVMLIGLTLSDGSNGNRFERVLCCVRTCIWLCRPWPANHCLMQTLFCSLCVSNG